MDQFFLYEWFEERGLCRNGVSEDVKEAFSNKDASASKKLSEEADQRTYLTEHGFANVLIRVANLKDRVNCHLCT